MYTLGLERILKGAAIMATDRDEVLRIGRTFQREARELVAAEAPAKFSPQTPTLEDVRDAIQTPINADAWKHTDVVGLAEVAKRAVEWLMEMSPPFLVGNGVLAEDFWPSALDYGPLLRGYALLCRPWTAWGLLKCGAMLPDEVACLMDVMPETLQAISACVLEAVINAKAAKKSWLPGQLVVNAVGVLQTTTPSQDQSIADLFGQQPEAPPQRPSTAKREDSEATPAQKRQADQGESHA